MEQRGSDRHVGEAFRPPATALPSWLPTRNQNRLPLDVYRGPGRFFATITTEKRHAWFRQAEIADYCANALRDACETEGFVLPAYCFMPDHVHLLVLTDNDGNLVRLIHRFKQQTGWWFRNRQEAGGLKASPTSPTTRPRLWQKSYYDHVLRRDDDMGDVVRYILENPVWAGLAASAKEYPYAWSAFDVPEPVLR